MDNLFCTSCNNYSLNIDSNGYTRCSWCTHVGPPILRKPTKNNVLTEDELSELTKYVIETISNRLDIDPITLFRKARQLFPEFQPLSRNSPIALNCVCIVAALHVLSFDGLLLDIAIMFTDETHYEQVYKDVKILLSNVTIPNKPKEITHVRHIGVTETENIDYEDRIKEFLQRIDVTVYECTSFLFTLFDFALSNVWLGGSSPSSFLSVVLYHCFCDDCSLFKPIIGNHCTKSKPDIALEIYIMFILPKRIEIEGKRSKKLLLKHESTTSRPSSLLQIPQIIPEQYKKTLIKRAFIIKLLHECQTKVGT